MQALRSLVMIHRISNYAKIDKSVKKIESCNRFRQSFEDAFKDYLQELYKSVELNQTNFFH
jgi:hypothetical protein